MSKTFTPGTPKTYAESEYTPRRADWMSNAGVRHWTPPAFDATPGRLAFSPNVVPLARHPDIIDRDGAVAAVLAAHLDRFNRFTQDLELRAVVPTCLSLRAGTTPFGVPGALAHDAGKAAIDEITHADAAAALRGATDSLVALPPPGFLAVLERSKAGLDRRQRALASTLFTTVSETLITGTLKQVPGDERVREDVRATLREHARDEAFHHALFGQLIGIVWPQMTAADHNVLGPLFALYITAFLGADTGAEQAVLVSFGFDPGQARHLVLEAAEIGGARASRRAAAAATLRFLERFAILEHDRTRQALEAEGLMP